MISVLCIHEPRWHVESTGKTIKKSYFFGFYTITTTTPDETILFRGPLEGDKLKVIAINNNKNLYRFAEFNGWWHAFHFVQLREDRVKDSYEEQN